MSAAPAADHPPLPRKGFVAPWLGLVAAVAVHVADEARTGFLSVYNPTVEEARARWPWFPAPTFTFRVWIFGLVAAVLLTLALTPLAASNRRIFRAVAAVLAVLMLLNGLGHIAGTIVGHTFADIRFPRPMPGFYSAPLLIAASVWLLYRLRVAARK